MLQRQYMLNRAIRFDWRSKIRRDCHISKCAVKYLFATRQKFETKTPSSQPLIYHENAVSF